MRYSSVDLLRTVALFVMVFVHFGENLSGYTMPFAGFGAPLFALLSGLSYYLWVQGQRVRGVDEETISKVSVRRGLFVFCVGIAFNILVWLPEDTFNWDVLTLIGVALLLLNQVRRLPRIVPVAIAAMSMLISPVLRHLADYNSYWQNGYFDPDLSLSDVIIGFLSTGYFPIFPWITFSLVGFVTASYVFPSSQFRSREGDATALPSMIPVLGIGASLLVFSQFALRLRSQMPAALGEKFFTGWTMFPPSTEYVLGTLGMAMMAFGTLHILVDRNPRVPNDAAVLTVAKTFSRYSFTIYILHHLVHVWPLWMYAVYRGQETTYYWKQAMPLATSLTLAACFMAVLLVLLRWAGPDRRLGVESWMRWLCD
ncbi:MAG: heparan-alpha-glucosaminide N-acetyltransferase domain-containing protein [Planctomycetaceae bacterium]